MRRLAVFDTEVFPNWYYVAFRDVTLDRVTAFEFPLDLEKIRKILKTYTIVGFNSNGYDLPLLMLALAGASVEKLKKASDRIIVHNLKPWHFEREFNVDLKDPHLDHIDLMEVAPLTGSLKAYGGRLHSKSLQDLPVSPSTMVSEGEKEILRRYCQNDLQTTLDLYHSLSAQLDLRTQMSAEYGLDLRSKSDAQIAEAVIVKEIETRTKSPVQRPNASPGDKFHYHVPDWLRFQDLDILPAIRSASFVVSDKGGILMPKELSDRKIEIAGKEYKLGLGGAHSCEKRQVIKTDSEYGIRDVDVQGFYPAIILNLSLYPKHLGPSFLEVYKSLVNRRLAEKIAGNKSVSESLKIVSNGTYGKLGSKWSKLYSPDLMIQVTVTGQLSMLMLVESLSRIDGVEVTSLNTDGLTYRYRREVKDAALTATQTWERATGFVLEDTDYDAVYSQDVSNYIAITSAGAVKAKGMFGRGLPLHKNPYAQICSTAMINYLQLDADVSETIKQCRDFCDFLCVRKVTGGAVWHGKEIGKIVRWFYATDEEEAITYKRNGHLVPATLHAKPCVELPDRVPGNLDYNWYINHTYLMLDAVGAS